MRRPEDKPSVLMIGALPPPFIGPNVAMANLLNATQLRNEFDLHFMDISDRRNGSNIGRLDLGNIALAFRHWVIFLFMAVKTKPQLVYSGVSQGSWGYLRDLGFLVPAIMLRKKVVVHLRGSEFGTFYLSMPFVLRKLTEYLFKRVTMVIVLGEKLRPVFEGLVAPHRIAVIPNGIDYTEFNQPLTREEKAANSGKRVLFLSSLRKRKGIFEFLASVPLVLKKHPDVRFTVAGEWRSLSEKKRGLSLISKDSISPAIKFVGEVHGQDKIRLYKEHDIFVFPPVEPEGLPWVILEAMSAGLPVITTNQGAISEIVQDNQTGFIVDCESNRIAEKISRLVQTPAAAAIMGGAGRVRIENQFSEKQYIVRLANAFKRATC